MALRRARPSPDAEQDRSCFEKFNDGSLKREFRGRVVVSSLQQQLEPTGNRHQRQGPMEVWCRSSPEQGHRCAGTDPVENMTSAAVRPVQARCPC